MQSQRESENRWGGLQVPLGSPGASNLMHRRAMRAFCEVLGSGHAPSVRGVRKWPARARQSAWMTHPPQFLGWLCRYVFAHTGWTVCRQKERLNEASDLKRQPGWCGCGCTLSLDEAGSLWPNTLILLVLPHATCALPAGQTFNQRFTGQRWKCGKTGSAICRQTRHVPSTLVPIRCGRFQRTSLSLSSNSPAL